MQGQKAIAEHWLGPSLTWGLPPLTCSRQRGSCGSKGDHAGRQKRLRALKRARSSRKPSTAQSRASSNESNREQDLCHCWSSLATGPGDPACLPPVYSKFKSGFGELFSISPRLCLEKVLIGVLQRLWRNLLGLEWGERAGSPALQRLQHYYANAVPRSC